MTKRLVRVYATYGKMDGEEVTDEFLFEDTAENREELLEDRIGMFSSCYDKEEFNSGETDSAFIHSDGGDWDEPTGFQIVIYDKDELISEIKSRCEDEIKGIERLFEKEDE